MNPFYITTPIYYVNDKPHIGHSYTTILGDVISRYHKMMGEPVWFLTGTDEHGQKVQKAADEKGISPIQQCDETVIRYQELWKKLGIGNDDFIRTTQERHTKIVQKILQDLYDRDLIYKAEYNGHYCVPCERFFTDKDLVDGNLCPDCHRPTNDIVESNYFFRMSKYQDWLIEYIQTHPDFIKPAFRANETLGFLKKPLEDLCISRPKARLSWGIELPFDKDYVCYVWFDALINYISAIGYGANEDNFKKWWPECHHLIGKDILTTHTVYWPTMLKAIGIEPPKTILAHGWWLSGRDKMSKSAGNVVNPMDMSEKYGVDAFRYYLLAEMTLGQDSGFTEDSFINRYNSDLANDLGNLANRAIKMTVRNFDSKIPKPGKFEELDLVLLNKANISIKTMENCIRALQPDKGIAEVMNVIRATNRYMEQTAPWTLAKEGNLDRLATVLYTAIEVLRIVGGTLSPVMPEKMAALLSAIGAPVQSTFSELASSGSSTPGTPITDIDGLFPRIMVEKEAAPAAKPEKKKEKAPVIKEQKPAPSVPEGCITIEDFFKTELRTAKVLAAEPVPKTEKLLKLQLEVGEEKRQIVAGIALFYKPEELIGKMVVIVANLMPAKLRGIESNGMLLAASAGDKLKLVTVDAADFPSGAKIG